MDKFRSRQRRVRRRENRVLCLCMYINIPFSRSFLHVGRVLELRLKLHGTEGRQFSLQSCLVCLLVQLFAFVFLK
jgi:hypothetical protein